MSFWIISILLEYQAANGPIQCPAYVFGVFPRHHFDYNFDYNFLFLWLPSLFSVTHSPAVTSAL